MLDVQQISSHEARRRQFSRIGKLLRNENETVILSYLTPKQGLKKTAQLQRWVDRIVKDGDPAINEFTKTYNATERHTLRQHYLRVHRDLKIRHRKKKWQPQSKSCLTMCSKLP